jgi:Holliday junction resolvase RusA-like endonuclease
MSQLGIAWSAEPTLPVLLSFEVFGDPRPKGNLNARPFFNPKTQKWGALCYDPDTGSAWRKAVHTAATAAKMATKLPVIHHSVVLEVGFFFRRPAGHHMGDDRARPLRATAPRYAVSHQCGDLGKLLRAVEDEITEAGVWKDDALVVSYGDSTKLWADTSRAVVRVLAVS